MMLKKKCLSCGGHMIFAKPAVGDCFALSSYWKSDNLIHFESGYAVDVYACETCGSIQLANAEALFSPKQPG